MLYQCQESFLWLLIYYADLCHANNIKFCLNSLTAMFWSCAGSKSCVQGAVFLLNFNYDTLMWYAYLTTISWLDWASLV